jgi:hypothetical protein
VACRGAFSVLDSAPVFVASVAAPAGPIANPGIVSALEDMGFPRVCCEKAAINTQNAGVEEAMNWLLAHMEDAGKWSSLQDRRRAWKLRAYAVAERPCMGSKVWTFTSWGCPGSLGLPAGFCNCRQRGVSE